ncbi:acyl-coenzyme A thioesterase 13 [Zingiber officinale]|uniref:Thioesterase domain-containing protein n=1 Tax=Zingiber officinale TaxID=94328 RepID=A0A8J5EZS1_ZINOF|nr:acyl-coenzyme A thioesterase 13 [Zingiber officinale]KAG6477855.1 hypothetical protein ZIOFF_061287 [Zingiber officinale]
MPTPPENRQKLDPMDAKLRLFPQNSHEIPGFAQKKGFYSDLHRSILKVDRVERGRVICSLTVDSAVANKYKTLHGGAVASVAEMVSLACAKTVAGDKDFFLGELTTAYLSSASLNEVITVDAFILRQGRSVVVTSVNFSTKTTGKLLYTSRSTFYIMPVASL